MPTSLADFSFLLFTGHSQIYSENWKVRGANSFFTCNSSIISVTSKLTFLLPSHFHINDSNLDLQCVALGVSVGINVVGVYFISEKEMMRAIHQKLFRRAMAPNLQN